MDFFPGAEVDDDDSETSGFRVVVFDFEGERLAWSVLTGCSSSDSLTGVFFCGDEVKVEMVEERSEEEGFFSGGAKGEVSL